MKKLFAVLMTLVLVLGMLSGCGSTAPAATETSAAGETENASAAEAGEAVPADTAADAPDAEEASELEEVPAEEAPEAEFNIYGPFAEDEIVLTYWKQWPPFLEGFDPFDASLFSTFYEDLNVRVEVTTIGTDSSDTKFSLMVAGGDYLDLIEGACSMYAGGGTKAIEDEVLIDLMPYMQTYAPDYWAILQQDEIAYKAMVNSDNQMGEFVGMYDQDPVPQSGLWVRKDWLDEQKMEKPQTLSELEDMLQMFKDEYGCTDAFACRDNCAIPVSNVYGSEEWSVDGDQVLYGYTDKPDAMKEYLRTAHSWFEKGFFSSGFITANDTTMPKSQMVVNGTSGLFDADILIVSEVGVLDPNVELEAMAAITKEKGDKIPYGWSTRMVGANKLSISTQCETPEYAVAYTNYAFTDQAFMAVNWGTEGETYTMENGQPVFTDLMLNNPSLPASFTPLAYISPGFPVLKSYDMTLSSYDYPAQKACYDIFASNMDKSLPNTGYPQDYVTYSTEESEVISQYKADLDTYVTECLAKFITGDLDVDKDYDAFAATLVDMGADDVKEVYQAAYERFLG